MTRTRGLPTLAFLAFTLTACGADGRGGSSGGGTDAGADAAPTDAGADAAPTDACTPDCSGRECGDDGCGGSCGSCADGTLCDDTGTCVCMPDCSGRECGDDGCGGSCGSCADGALCDDTGTCVAPPRIVINEIDYDQPRRDTAEFIELYNAGASPATLDGLSVVLVNGRDGSEYHTIPLSGTLPAGGFALVQPMGSTSPTPMGVPVFLYDNNIQNGSPDCVKLVQSADGSLLDGVSYEGMVPGCGEGTDGAPTDITRDDMGGDVEGSIARIPDGTDTDDNAADFVFTTMPTPGQPNR